MAQNFWMAIFAWSACFTVTILVSLATAPRPTEQLRGLVYGLTRIRSNANHAWYRRPGILACVVLALVLVLNVVFR
jgi:SSS family solute:Na+ symporter